MYNTMACRGFENITCRKEVVEDILRQLTPKFGQDKPLITSRGKILDYICMQSNYCTKGRVTFSMEEYIYKLLNEVPHDIDFVAKTPATNHLFNINDNANN